jgi:hypothetical protein
MGKKRKESVKKRHREFVTFLVYFSLLAGISAQAQTKPVTPAVQQKSEKSACSNIVALTGNIDLHCASLTPEQAATILETRNLVKKMLTGQVDVRLIQQMNEKLNEFIAQRSAGDIDQKNSGGLNILQGTTGANSPIINSPINVGLQKAIATQDRASIVAFLQSAPLKSKYPSGPTNSVAQSLSRRIYTTSSSKPAGLQSAME